MKCLLMQGMEGEELIPFISAISSCAKILRDEYPKTFPLSFLIKCIEFYDKRSEKIVWRSIKPKTIKPNQEIYF